MGQLQALVTGAIAGSLMKANEDHGITIEVEPVMDEHGYLPQIKVRGLRSDEKLLVHVEEVDEWPS